MKANIPESLRQQLSRAGKIGSKNVPHEARVRAGKAAWAARVAKAKDAERRAAQRKRLERPDAPEVQTPPLPSPPANGNLQSHQ